MKVLSLLMWVTQFGLSILVPPCFFLLIAHWLQIRFGLGGWVMVILGILGLLTAFSTAKANLRAMLKAVKELSDNPDPPTSFNNHN
ncbi:MAG: AtpZ/AtpI family protein [Oscillospiraceae bacterium]|nr:AtpZ/AtpI family protein [Oscillospiraceae bacterium]